jgi:hypothetical protein
VGKEGPGYVSGTLAFPAVEETGALIARGGNGEGSGSNLASSTGTLARMRWFRGPFFLVSPITEDYGAPRVKPDSRQDFPKRAALPSHRRQTIAGDLGAEKRSGSTAPFPGPHASGLVVPDAN